MLVPDTRMNGKPVETRTDKSPSPPRVLLIKSPQNDTTSTQFSHPLGLMNIAAYLRNTYCYDVKIVDMRINQHDRFDVEPAIRAFAPDVVGISALTHESDAVPRIAGCVKRVNADTPVLLGGPHATAYPDKAVNLPGIDYVVVGEGEITAGLLIERLLHKRDVSGIQGIVYRKDNRVFSTGRGDYIKDLNDLPMPAHDLIPIEAYGKFTRMSRTGSGPYMCLFSSRGCPFHCIYCHNIFGKAFRCRSAENLFNEIKHLYDTYGIRDFEIMDDIFNLDRGRLIEFCDRIIGSGMKVTFAFPNGLRGDILDREQLVKLRQAGTIFIAFAIETGSPRLQRMLKKNIRLDTVKKNIEIARSLGILSHGFTMIGFPGETPEEMRMTVDFLISSRLHTFAMFAVMPFENTELAEIAKKAGHQPVSDFSMDYWSKKFVNLTDVPSATINHIRRTTVLKFYLDPLRIFAIARDFPDKRALVKLSLLFFRRLLWRS
jgi:anaerobic magnesium-protoporphyrin IX monomethyl ester cyclase